MGGGPSKSVHYEHAAAVFTNNEKEQINNIFHKICAGDTSASSHTTDSPRLGRHHMPGHHHNHTFDQVKLQAFLHGYLTDNLCASLFVYLVKLQGLLEKDAHSQHGKVTVEALTIALAHMLKGSLEERAHLVCHLAGDGEVVSSTHLMQFASHITSSYQDHLKSCDGFASWKMECPASAVERLSACLTKDLLQRETEGPADADLSETLYGLTDIEDWLSKCGILIQMMDTVLHRCFPVSSVEGASAISPTTRLFPVCEGANWQKFSSILDVPSVLLLNYNIMPELRTPWRLLFHSQVHGESFSTLVKHIRDKGPNIIVIKDTEGNVFGGFASESWSVRPQFVGSTHCFLFSLKPSMDVYVATGHNEHFMYLNQGQETMPNGLGMGGQLDYFGLWLDAEYGTGHSKAQPTCTTYGSPQLSADPLFKIQTLEIWGVGQDPSNIKLEDEDGNEKKFSILDSDPEAKAMLALIDKGPVSEGLRETDMTADIPEVHEIPPLS